MQKISFFSNGRAFISGSTNEIFAETVNVVLEGFWHFYRVFKAKHGVAVKSNLVQHQKLNNFRVDNFLRFCENFCANQETKSDQEAEKEKVDSTGSSKSLGTRLSYRNIFVFEF